MAVDVLKSRGVPEERIIFLNLIASPEGVKKFTTKFPKLRVVTAFIDDGLDEHRCGLPMCLALRLQLTVSSYIVPGLGDFGDRYYTV